MRERRFWVDRSQAREVLSRLPYGLYVAGSRDGDNPVAMIATWVTQVSFFPQLLAIAVENQEHFIRIGMEMMPD